MTWTRSSVVLIGLLASTVTVALPGVALAADTGANLGLGGSAVAVGIIDKAVLVGDCNFVQVAAGLNSSGSTYVLEGVGSAGGTVGGSPVVATGVKCTYAGRTAGPTFTPGVAGVTTATFTANSTSGAICTTVYYLTQAGTSGALPSVCK